MIMPFTCSTCKGYKTVQKPPWIVGDQPLWVSNSAGNCYPCPSCNGTGIVWNERHILDPKEGVQKHNDRD